MAILPDVPDTCVPLGFRERVLARAILRAYECDDLAWHHWRGEFAHSKMPKYNISLPLRLPFCALVHTLQVHKSWRATYWQQAERWNCDRAYIKELVTLGKGSVSSQSFELNLISRIS